MQGSTKKHAGHSLVPCEHLLHTARGSSVIASPPPPLPIPSHIHFLSTWAPIPSFLGTRGIKLSRTSWISAFKEELIQQFNLGSLMQHARLVFSGICFSLQPPAPLPFGIYTPFYVHTSFPLSGIILRALFWLLSSSRCMCLCVEIPFPHSPWHSPS